MSGEGNACSPACGFCGMCNDEPRGNATCTDCGEDFWKGRDDVGGLCDRCCDLRDAHTTALEARWATKDVA